MAHEDLGLGRIITEPRLSPHSGCDKLRKDLFLVGHFGTFWDTRSPTSTVKWGRAPLHHTTYIPSKQVDRNLR
jgi:hypothetical protein